MPAAAAPAATARAAAYRVPMPPRREAPRLSLAQPYRPCAADDLAPLGAAGGCGASAAPPAAPPGLATAVAAASARARTRVDADALHALALADLAWADSAGNALDRSISTLRTVARLDARPAPALADLAAALLVRADRRRDARDLFEAADVASLALESDSAFAPAHFNLALALGRIGLVDETARAWAAFLAVEPRGPWADEARRRAAQVAAVSPPSFDPRAADLAAAAARAPQEARLYGWNEALGRWGAATLAGDAGAAARELAWARTVGQALEARGGDATLADAVRVIEAAAPNVARTRALAAAHRAFAEGAAHYSATRYEEARRGLAVAARAPGPLGLWARAFGGMTHTYAGRRGSAEVALRRVLAHADSRRYLALTGRTRWMLGTTLMRAGRTEEAYAQGRQATRAFSRGGEREYLGAVQALTMQAAFGLGDSRATFTAAHEALASLQPYRGSIWLHTALFLAAVGADRDGLSRVALRLQDEGVTVAVRTGAPAYPAEARLVRARLSAGAGAAARARAAGDVAVARRELALVHPGPIRDWITADLRVAEASLLAGRNGSRAVGALDSVIAYFDRPPVPMRLVPALVARADARLSLGDTSRAERDLDHALALLAADQGRTRNVPLRASLVGATRAVTSRAVMAHAARGEAVASLTRLERGTAGLAWDARPDSPRRVARARRGQTVLVYSLIGDTLLTWAIRDTATHLTRAILPRASFGRVLERARTSLERHTADAALADLGVLYEWLVHPVRADLPPGAPVVVVDHGDLGTVPWAALFDRERGRYLVEDHVLHTAVGLGGAAPRGIWPAGTRPRPTPGHASHGGAVLLVSDPAIDTSAYPTLRPLAGAAAEVQELAARYPGARVLAGRDATVSALLPALRRSTLVHYAGHAVFDDERPERSRLVLAPDIPGTALETESGALTAERVASLDLQRIDLVVLAACETVQSQAGRAEGFAGLAGAFAAAGAGGVLGALWRVDDQATRALMREFYRAYTRTGDAAGALRAAQLELLRSNDPDLRSPASWAGFRYLGG